MYELCVCILLDADCIFFQKLNADCVFFQNLNTYCVFYPAVMGELMSARPSLQWILVVMGVMTSTCPSILDATIATGG
jgi:hypothetical protein